MVGVQPYGAARSFLYNHWSPLKADSDPNTILTIPSITYDAEQYMAGNAEDHDTPLVHVTLIQLKENLSPVLLSFSAVALSVTFPPLQIHLLLGIKIIIQIPRTT